MSSPEDVMVGNLVEALQQLQRFMVFGLGSSVSALVLSGARPTRSEDSDVTVPGTFVAVDRNVARLLLLGLCILSGAMATYSAESVTLLYSKLNPEMRNAACTFPSVATSKYTGVRMLAAVLPFIFSMIAVWRVVRPYHQALQSMGGWAIVLGAAYLPLAFQLWAPQCLAR